VSSSKGGRGRGFAAAPMGVPAPLWTRIEGESERAGGRREGTRLSKTRRVRRGGAHATSEASHVALGYCTRSAMKATQHAQIQKSNSTPKMRLNINLSPFVTPNPFSFGTICSN